jgi:hypothetical protein
MSDGIAPGRMIAGMTLGVVVFVFAALAIEPYVPNYLLWGGDACPDNPKLYCGAWGGVGAVLMVPCLMYGMLVAHVSERTPSMIEVVR